MPLLNGVDAICRILGAQVLQQLQSEEGQVTLLNFKWLTFISTCYLTTEMAETFIPGHIFPTFQDINIFSYLSLVLSELQNIVMESHTIS